jgi:Icc-related predicted phosphoesterase
MRIAATSDTHGYHERIKTYPEADIFVFAGDCSQTGRLPDLFKFSNWINQLPYKHKIVIAGNHDWGLYRDLSLGSRLFEKDTFYLLDQEVVVNNVKFYGSPWTTEFCGWAFMKEEPELENKWSRIPEDTDVLITHGPPWDILDRNQQGECCGSKSLFLKLNNSNIPIHIFGHIHEARGQFVKTHGTRCYNVSYDPTNPELRIIDL